MSGFSAVGYFLIAIIFSSITLLIWMRIAIRYLGFSPSNQLSAMVYTLTNPVINPLNKIFKIPAKSKYDWAAFAALVVVEFIKIMCISLISFYQLIPIPLLILYVLADLIIQPLNLMFYALIIRVVLSYTNPNWRHPFVEFLYRVTQPLIHIGRRIIPNISGFDFAPFIMMIILKVFILFISNSLPGRLL